MLGLGDRLLALGLQPHDGLQNNIGLLGKTALFLWLLSLF